jgi:signal transduction histidine kinase
MPGTLGSLDSLKDVPLHLALDYTGVGLVACDESGLLTLISPAMQEMFDLPPEQFSEPFYVEGFLLFREDGETPLPSDEVPLSQARRGAFVRDALVTSRRSDGSLLHLKVNAAPLRDDQGHDIGALALIQDVTVERTATLRAEALQRRLVEKINHEFRTPLAALLGHVQLIHDHRDRCDQVDPELAGWLAAIERSGWRLRDLVEQVAGLVNAEEIHAEAIKEPAAPGSREVRAG